MLSIHVDVKIGPDELSPRDQLDSALSAIGFIRDGYRVIEKDAGHAESPAEVVLRMMSQPAPSIYEELTKDGPLPLIEPEAPAEPKKRGRPAKAKAETKPEPVAEAEPQIRANPENRVEEPEEDAIQDMADEVAEVEAARDPVNPLTLDDVRQALGAYVMKYGTPAAMEDGVKILEKALGNPPEGEPIWKMSIIPDDQDALRKAAVALKAAIEGNPYGREAV